MRSRYFVPLILALALSVSACGKAAQVAVDADDALFGTIESLKLAKDARCDSGEFPASACVALAKAFVPVWDSYLAINRGLAGGSALDDLQPAVQALKDSGREFAAQAQVLSEGEGKRILLDILTHILTRY